MDTNTILLLLLFTAVVLNTVTIWRWYRSDLACSEAGMKNVYWYNAYRRAYDAYRETHIKHEKVEKWAKQAHLFILEQPLGWAKFTKWCSTPDGEVILLPSDEYRIEEEKPITPSSDAQPPDAAEAAAPPHSARETPAELTARLEAAWKEMRVSREAAAA